MRRYRSLLDASELARLAALMAPAAKAGNPTTQAEAALANSLAAHEALSRHREAMACEMDSTTLIRLQTQLVEELVESGKHRREEWLADPLAGPVVREIDRRLAREIEDSGKSEAFMTKAALEQADRRSQRTKRPSLPCSLHQALVYAARPFHLKEFL